MITVNNIALQYGKRVLFEDVNLKFTEGNCYGVIGANGAGKSTLLKIISGAVEATRGHVSIEKGKRMAILKQDHFAFENETVLDTVIMGHAEMYRIMKEKDAIYMNPDATDAELLHATELENHYGEMGGWTAYSDAAELLSNIGIREDKHGQLMRDLTGGEKVKVLLAQALFGNPDMLLLDEPTNDLDAKTIAWLADFLADFRNLVIVVSHDRYFLDMVCTHMVDIDYGQVRIFTGNYSFWYESSQLMSRQLQDKNQKTEARRKELQEFIARFSANASKSKQATSRKKALEKLTLEEIRPSSRRYPYIAFKPSREPGGQILKVEGLSKKNENGEYLFRNVSFTMSPGDKIALIAERTASMTALLDILAGESQADSGTITWGQTITHGYLPNDNSEYFSKEQDLPLTDWLKQFTKETDDQFIRGFLGRMLFSGDEVMKRTSVLSGGEKVRCMLSKLMLAAPNFLLLDEPTNHLDMEAVITLNNAMKEFTGNMIFTTHDFQINQSVANRVIELLPDGTLDKMIPFEEYVALMRERDKVA